MLFTVLGHLSHPFLSFCSFFTAAPMEVEGVEPVKPSEMVEPPAPALSRAASKRLSSSKCMSFLLSSWSIYSFDFISPYNRPHATEECLLDRPGGTPPKQTA